VPESLFANYTRRSDKAMIYAVAAGHGLNEQRSAEILDRKHRIYESLEHTLCPVAGAIEFVHWADSRYRLALATSATSRNRQETLKSLQIESMFEVVVDSASFSQPKPSPEVFQIALKRLALAPAACLVIEDAVNGSCGESSRLLLGWPDNQLFPGLGDSVQLSSVVWVRGSYISLRWVGLSKR
jgi:HAD superfamily hydrolase (TIGR01509 family)